MTSITFKGSSNVKEARFDEATSVVEVEFGNGTSYRYKNFTKELLDEWGEAKSAGQWFSDRVKKRPDLFPVEKLPGDPTTVITPPVDEMEPAKATPSDSFRPPLPPGVPYPGGTATLAEQDRALARALAELDRTKVELRRMKDTIGSVESRIISEAVEVRTRELNSEIETLRKRVALLEQQARDRLGARDR